MRSHGRRMALLVPLVAAWLLAGRGAADDAPPVAAADADLIAKLSDPATRDAAAKALVDRGAAAVPALVAALPDAKVRLPVVDVLCRLGPLAKGAVSPLTAIVRNAAHSARVPAARALAAIGAAAAPALPALGAWAGEPKGPSRAEAIVAIERILVAAAAPGDRKRPVSDVDRCVAAGCDWLMRHQNADGRWSCQKFPDLCKGDARCDGNPATAKDIGLTALATLALLGPRDSDGDAAARAAAVRGSAWLTAIQDKDGFLGDQHYGHDVYDHLCAGFALCEMWRVTGDEKLRGPVERAAAFTERIRGRQSGGWRYMDTPGQSDTSVTVWAMKFLTAAAARGVKVGDDAAKGALAWVESMTEPEFGRCGYQNTGGPPARTVEMMYAFPADKVETLTACGVEVRLLAGRSRLDDPAIEKGLGLLAKKPPRWDVPAIDFYYWYHGSAVARWVAGSGYEAWRKALVTTLLPHQRAGAAVCARGSWDPVDPWSPDGGRVYSTTMALLALEACDVDPADRPPLSSENARIVTALEKAAADGDPAAKTVRAAAIHALDAVHAVYR